MKSKIIRSFGGAALLALALFTSSGIARAELLAWWPLDSPSSAPGADAAPGARHRLQFLGGSGELTDGLLPGALAWTTAGGDSAHAASFPATTAFSFSVWVKRDPGTSGGSDQLATIARLGERNNSGWALYVGATGTWTAYAYGAQARKLDSKTAATRGAWTHLAVTFAPAAAASAPATETTGLLCLYVNGRLANKGEFAIGRDGDTLPFMLGARHYNGVASWPFAGQISQVAVWDEAVPASLVAELAKGRSPGAGLR